MLPDVHGPPPENPQLIIDTAVTLPVPLDLVDPPVPVCLRDSEVVWAAVPEAAIDEDSDTDPKQDDVGAARQAVLVEPEPDPALVQLLPEANLWFGALGSLGPHGPGDVGGRCDGSTAHRTSVEGRTGWRHDRP